jgi:hypothetical protein
LAALMLALALGLPAPAQAQDGVTVQGGLALVPGLGAQVGGVQAGRVFTREAMLQVDYRPAFIGESGGVQVSVAFGASVRVYGILRTIGNEQARLHPLVEHVDVGVRIGPGLFFEPDETRADKNQRLRPFFDPFVRFTSDAFAGGSGERPFFAEIGVQRPYVRLGFWWSL